MDVFDVYLDKIENPEHKARLQEVFAWIDDNYPDLDKRIAWSQPMYTHHGTFIIAFSTAKAHMAVSPEEYTMDRFDRELEEAGYKRSSMIFRIPWDKPVDYDLLGKMIEFNIEDKAGHTGFWR